jgi:hypothetical protein
MVATIRGWAASIALLALCAASCGGHAEVVVLDASGTGNATEMLDSGSKNGWDLHWRYDCSSTGGHGVFVADVLRSDKTPDFTAPGVNEEGDKDSGVYHVPGAGRFYLEITSTCKWTVKVVESP